MASYSQWARKRETRRLTWLCGTEPVLAEEVIAHARSQADECFTLVAGDDAERDVWAAASQPPGDESRWLVVVRCAQRLKRWSELESLTAARDLLSVRVLFHSEEGDFTKVMTEEGRKDLAPHLRALQSYRSGQLIRCAVPDEPEEWVSQWVSRRLGGGGVVLADYLLECTGYDLSAAADAADKLRLARVPVTRENIVLVARGFQNFTESVLRGKRQQALSAAPRLTRDEQARAIGRLSSALDTLLLLHEASVTGLDAREIALKLGVRSYQQKLYKGIADSYSAERVASCKAVLATADAAWHEGITEGVAEVIAVLWAA
jgi:DNA polymerase III delta subunit